MRIRSYTDQELVLAVATSQSIAEVLRKLNLVPAGGNYETVHSKIKALGLATNHFHGQGWRKGSVVPVVPPALLKDLLVNERRTSSQRLKQRLISSGLKSALCAHSRGQTAPSVR